MLVPALREERKAGEGQLESSSAVLLSPTLMSSLCGCFPSSSSPTPNDYLPLPMSPGSRAVQLPVDDNDLLLLVAGEAVNLILTDAGLSVVRRRTGELFLCICTAGGSGGASGGWEHSRPNRTATQRRTPFAGTLGCSIASDYVSGGGGWAWAPSETEVSVTQALPELGLGLADGG